MTLEQLASLVGGKIVGKSAETVNYVANLINATEKQITFLTQKSHLKNLAKTKATAVILTEENLAECKTNAIVVENPILAYAIIAKALCQKPPLKPSIHKLAVVDSSAIVHPSAVVGAFVVIEAGVSIAENCIIGSHSFIGEGVSLADDIHIYNNVSIMSGCSIGARTIIHPGAIIGADGFGNANDQGRWVKIPQLGAVVIGSDVEVGASTMIDCGSIGDTIIGNGVRLDNLIHIGHNVVIGDHTAIAGLTGVAGSTIIGQYCMIGGTVAIAGHIEVADRVTITGRSTVFHSIKNSGIYSSGSPLAENNKWRKNYVHLKKLGELVKRVKTLEKNITSSEDK